MRLINSLTFLLALFIVVACGESQERQNDESPALGDQPTQPQTPPPGGEQDQTDTNEDQLGGAMESEPQEEFVDQMQTRLDQAEEQLDEVRQNAENLGEDQGQQTQERYDQIEERISNTRDQLSELEDASSDDWEQLSQEVMNRVNDIEEDIQTLSGGGGIDA
ncbi:MAG: hypothetical protein WD267_01340 [Balneolales bacterium]